MFTKKNFIITVLLLVLAVVSSAQHDTTGATYLAPFATFSTTRLLNNHTTETLGKRAFDFRVTHRFGDIGGDNGGYHNFWGLDNSADIRIAFEYGINDHLMIGVGRSKGGGTIRELFDGFIKYRLMKPTEKLPLSLTALGSGAVSTMRASSISTSESSFSKDLHRLRYVAQLIAGYKLNSRFSFQVVPSYLHRNYVAADVNSMIALGAGTRIKLTQLVALNFEYTYNQLMDRGSARNYYDAVGIGIEFDLGGHVFQLDITNSKGIGEYQFISGTTSAVNPSKGQYRMGFTISRPFKL